MFTLVKEAMLYNLKSGDMWVLKCKTCNKGIYCERNGGTYSNFNFGVYKLYNQIYRGRVCDRSYYLPNSIPERMLIMKVW